MQWIKDRIEVSPNFATTVESSIDSLGLSPQIINNLKKMEISHLFPIQLELLNRLEALKHLLKYKKSDILCSATTGSGKTLGYAVPIVSALLDRVICKIRCLVVVPTRELAIQVRETFNSLLLNTNLSVGMAIGQTSFHHEQSLLMNELKEPKCDILVCTPGRLIDHIKSGLPLQSIRCLVLDEADRLMNQKYHGWLDILYQAINEQPRIDMPGDYSNTRLPVQKLLFSATLNTNPQQIESLKLKNPVLITLGNATNPQSTFTLPIKLLETMVVIEPSEKVLVILDYFANGLKQVLIFVKSVEGATRLSFLINACFGKEISKPITSNLNSKQRRSAIKEFRTGKINALVASDVMARGVDFEQNVNAVINYDCPPNVITYVHRVGRTARAGNSGSALTILEPKQARWFKKEILSSAITRSNEMIKKRFKENSFNPLIKMYKRGLKLLQKEFATSKSDLEEIETDSSSDSDSDSTSESESAIESVLVTKRKRSVDSQLKSDSDTSSDSDISDADDRNFKKLKKSANPIKNKQQEKESSSNDSDTSSASENS